MPGGSHWPAIPGPARLPCCTPSPDWWRRAKAGSRSTGAACSTPLPATTCRCPKDRKSGVQGKSVSVSVDFGGRRLLNKTIIRNKAKLKRKHTNTDTQQNKQQEQNTT